MPFLPQSSRDPRMNFKGPLRIRRAHYACVRCWRITADPTRKARRCSTGRQLSTTTPSGANIAEHLIPRLIGRELSSMLARLSAHRIH